MIFFAASVAGRTHLEPTNADRQIQSEHAAYCLAALGEMTAGISHDLRNILTVIQSGLNLAARNGSDPVAVETYLQAAHDGVTRGIRLTSRLLSLARDSHAHADDVNVLVRSLETFIKYGAGAGIKVEIRCAPELPLCLIDPPRFNAALLNLIVNARDAMPQGGFIRISTALEDGEIVPHRHEKGRPFVRVSITDTGHGMPPEVAERIFDPYFSTKGENGTGLGLPQVYASMREVGGYVRVSSEVGEGTTFDLLFPVSELAAPPAAGRVQHEPLWAIKRPAIEPGA